MSERLYTLREAALERLKFPSPDALKMYLARRRGLVGVRYIRDGRSTKRVLTEEEVSHLQDIRVWRGSVKGNSP